MIVLQPAHNEFNSFNNPRSFDSTSIGNFSHIPSQNIPTTMYQAAASSQYQTQPFVYGNPSITYTSNNNNFRTSPASSLPRQMPTDASFGLEANSYSQLTYNNNRYDQSTGTDGSKASSLQQNPASSMIPSTTTANLSPDSNVLPPLSEVFSSSSSAQSPTQSQVQNAQQVQNQQVAAAAAAAQNNFYYSTDVANAAAAASYAAESNYGNNPNSLMSQAQQSLGQQAAQPQIATNIPTLPRIGNAADLQAQMLARRESNALLAINTGMLGTSDQSPISAGSSATSPIVYQQAAHQALLNSHFMAATQSMNGGLIPSSQRLNGHRKGFRSDDGDLTSATGDRPQKVYSFVALPGINTKKRPRRRYDEIERHYACNYPGCTKSYGTLNHLNAHVQMQKHGQKRHPSGKS